MVTQILKSGKTYGKEVEALNCPVCGVAVDYLLGEDDGKGGRQGCERCYIPSKVKHSDVPNENTFGEDVI